jgi:hypothetical protein
LIEESFDILFKLQQPKQANNVVSNELNTQTASNTASSSLSSAGSSAINDELASNLKQSLSLSNSSSLNSLLSEQSTAVNRLFKADQMPLSHQQQQIALNYSNQLNQRKNRKNPIVNLLNGDLLIDRKNTGIKS